MSFRMSITRHIVNALAAEMADRWVDAADAWLDAFVCCVTNDGTVREAQIYLANSRAANKAAADAAYRATHQSPVHSPGFGGRKPT